jgi:hypothetical protein
MLLGAKMMWVIALIALAVFFGGLSYRRSTTDDDDDTDTRQVRRAKKRRQSKRRRWQGRREIFMSRGSYYRRDR